MSKKEINQVVASSYQLYINGEWTTGSGNKMIASYNPSNGEKLAEFVDATNADVDRAVEAAQEAFQTWKDVDVVTRSNLLLKIADLIEENQEHLAMVETLDNGKPLRETQSIDVPASADHFRYFASVIRGEEGSVKEFDKDTLSIVVKEPIDVVGQIIPWNFPLLMGAWKLAPALAAGNTVVIHPSSSTSLSLLELFKIFDQVLPKGVVNLITGRGSDSGNYMLAHPGFDKLAFTGSTEVGYTVAKAAADRLIPATLELGGKSANIIFEDANWERALEGVQLGILFNQGQVCCAGSRVFVQSGIYDQFVEALKEKFEQVNVGFPWEKDVEMGAQINEHQLEEILKYVEIGVKEGATLITGGQRLTENGLDKGAFLAPTLLANGTNTMCVAQEEIFGPVATVIKFETEEEVIRLANDSEYGLGGAVFSQDINVALRVARGVRTGRMWVNTYNQLPAGAPFGGYKKSGIGRETHKSMLDAYTQMKNIYIVTKEEADGLY